MSTLGLYHRASSPLHRAPAGPKLLGATVSIVALTVWVTQPWQVPVAGAVVLGLYLLARIPPRPALHQLRPLLWMLAVVGVFQFLLAGWERAVVVCGELLGAVALAALVTLTTRVGDMLDAVVAAFGPFRRLGVDPERAGLVLVLTVRAVPMLAGIVAQVAEARKARGLGFSLRALAVPVVVGSLLTAEAMGEALAARGLDD